VMCPDIETYAPLIHASFGGSEPVGEPLPGGLGPGLGEGGPSTVRRLQVRLADRSLRQTNPVLSVAAQLLELAQSRITASQVLDLAAREPVRRRFDFEQDDLARIGSWVERSGIRWGLDGEHRRAYQLGDLDANTFQSGLDRALLGATMAGHDERLFEGVVPLDDVDSGDIDLLGRLAELVDRLRTAVAALTQRQTISEWAERLSIATSSLTASTHNDAWQMVQLRRLLADVVGEATVEETTSEVVLGLGDVTTLLGDRLRGDRRERTSARGISRSALSSRCARCRIVSCAYSASMMAPSPATPGATATTSSSPIPASATTTLVTRTTSSSSTPCWRRPIT